MWQKLDLGITGGGSDLTVNDRVLRITAFPALQNRWPEWKTEITPNGSEYLLPDEPIRFTTEALDRLLLHCVNLAASDITIQTSTTDYGRNSWPSIPCHQLVKSQYRSR